MSVIYSLCLLQTVCVCHTQLLSATEHFVSQTVSDDENEDEDIMQMTLNKKMKIKKKMKINMQM